MSERLTPLSTTFLDVEDGDPRASLAIGSITVFEGPAPAFEELVSAIRGRLPLLPRYRQRLRTAPFDLTAPVWVDDPDFNLRWHLRGTAVPAPGGPAELGNLMSRVMTRRMDRRRPLWEYWFVGGLAGGRWALLSKLHHSMVDGVSGTDIYRLVLDPGPEPVPALPDDWTPERTPSSAELVAGGAWHLVSDPVASLRAAAGLAGAPLRVLRRAQQTARGLLALSGAAVPEERTSLVGPLDGDRRFAWTTTSLSTVRETAHAFGGTVNDVVLAAVTGGFRTLLLSRGEEPTPHALRSLVPVDVRAPGQAHLRDNRVSLMLPYLPVDVADPLARLAAVRERIDELQEAGEPEAGEVLTGLAASGPFLPVAWGLRLAFRLPQRVVGTVTTNVPGPRTPLYALGRRVETIVPYVPIANRVRVGVAITSYCDDLTVAVTGDYASVPDIDVLVDAVAGGLAELVELAALAEAAAEPVGGRVSPG